MNKYEENMVDLMGEQNELILYIEGLKNDIGNVKEKHIRDFKLRELIQGYEELLNSAKDIQNLFNNLIK